MDFESKLNKTELEIYNILNQDTTDKAKNFTKEGGSLDKLRKVAEKAIKDPSIEKEIKNKVYANLKEAVEGKKVYYKEEKMGRITSFLKSKPVFSKFFDDPIKKANNFLTEGIGKEGKDIKKDNKTKAMIDNYSKQIDKNIEKLDEIIEKLRNISEDKDFDKNLSDDSFRYGSVAGALERWKYDRTDRGKTRIMETAKDQIEYLEEKKVKLNKIKKQLEDLSYSKKTKKSDKEPKPLSYSETTSNSINDRLNVILNGVFESGEIRQFKLYVPGSK